MRIALVLLIALSAVGCAKKKAATTPTPAAPAAGSAAEAQPGAPASAPDTTPAPQKSSDPEEGGQ